MPTTSQHGLDVRRTACRQRLISAASAAEAKTSAPASRARTAGGIVRVGYLGDNITAAPGTAYSTHDDRGLSHMAELGQAVLDSAGAALFRAVQYDAMAMPLPGIFAGFPTPDPGSASYVGVRLCVKHDDKTG
ncbi:hypothetical protein ACJZ2D_014869 [Fusarium nematophilum]